MIMIVEDDADNASALREVLEEEGYQVTRACDGADALKKLSGGPAPGLILLDYMMPEMDGSQLARAVKADKRFAEIPLVMLTANGRAASRALGDTITQCLAKPVELNTLLDTVRKYYRAA
jgi:two-component system, chemotaxis family, chemotaxis protein CheY